MQTPYEKAFLREVITNPELDTPRLLYADWLEEQGRSNHAEFIRVQIKIAEVSCTSHKRGKFGTVHKKQRYDCKSCDACKKRINQRINRKILGKIEKALLSKLHRNLLYEITQPLKFTLKSSYTQINPAERSPFWALVRRGFVGEITFPMNDFIQHAKELFSNHPIKQVIIIDKQPEIRAATDHHSYVSSGWMKRYPKYRYNYLHHIPSSLWPTSIKEDRAWFRGTQAALEELSKWCIAYGRKQAGLEK